MAFFSAQHAMAFNGVAMLVGTESNSADVRSCMKRRRALSEFDTARLSAVESLRRQGDRFKT
jgi:hypothetical protein